MQAATHGEDVFAVENRTVRDSMIAAGTERAGLYTYQSGSIYALLGFFGRPPFRDCWLSASIRWYSRLASCKRWSCGIPCCRFAFSAW